MSETAQLPEQFLVENQPSILEQKGLKFLSKRREAKGEENLSPSEKVHNFMEDLEQTHLSHGDNPIIQERLFRYYKNKYVIKPDEVPQSYFDNQIKLAREQGRGDLNMDESGKAEIANILIIDQGNSLKNWFRYFTSKDSEAFPMWFKYFAFNRVLRLSRNKDINNIYEERLPGTVALFPELNREALALVEDAMVKKYTPEYFEIKSQISAGERYERTSKIIQYVEQFYGDSKPKIIEVVLNGQKINIKRSKYEDLKNYYDQPENKPKETLDKLNENLNRMLSTLPENMRGGPKEDDFGKLYADAFEKTRPVAQEGLANIRGKWVIYEQGSDETDLVNSLQGYGTGWCTAGQETAKSQLKGGDFHVFYSEDKNGEPKIPRVAIRMEGESIVEVRGIAKEQNLDPYISPVVDEKLKEFPDGDQYYKKVQDMKQLTEIEKKVLKDEELSKGDLRFLYELPFPIEGFGYEKDPRIEDIKSKRNPISDLAVIFDCSANEISSNNEDAIKGRIKFHRGNLSLRDLTDMEGVFLPKNIGGNLSLPALTTIKNFEFPENVYGNLFLLQLTLAENVKFPKTIGKTLELSIKTFMNIELPEEIGEDLYLNRLTSVQGLTLPKIIRGNLRLGGLKSAKGLNLLNTNFKSLLLNGLISAEGLILPDNIKGNLDLVSLTEVGDLQLPKRIGGNLYLNKSLYSRDIGLSNIHIGGKVIYE